MASLQTRCCIVGGGPAGMMAGLLLARAGIDTIVIEKHADFFRDFRGDTIHPSTMQMLHEAGLSERFLQRPHDELEVLQGQVGDEMLTVADFSKLPTIAKFLAFMPQWDFLNFLREESLHFPSYRLMMETEFAGLVRDGERVTGIRARNRSGEEIAIAADVVIAADGRHSAVRESAQLPVRRFGAPMDILWMRIPKEGAHAAQTLGYVAGGKIVVLINRNEYWQAGLVIAKGTYETLRSQPVSRVREMVSEVAPIVKEHVHAIASWDDVRYLEVRVDRLERWWTSGLLCIGDAAHAMSPIGGVGINLAIQDAVATSNELWRPLQDGSVSDAHLARVQRLRTFPTVATQSVQLLIQRGIIRNVLKSERVARAPWLLRMVLARTPARYLTARVVGLGFRPERIRSPLRELPMPSPVVSEASPG